MAIDFRPINVLNFKFSRIVLPLYEKKSVGLKTLNFQFPNLLLCILQSQILLFWLSLFPFLLSVSIGLQPVCGLFIISFIFIHYLEIHPIEYGFTRHTSSKIKNVWRIYPSYRQQENKNALIPPSIARKVISLSVLDSCGPNSFRGARGRCVVVVRARYFLRGRVSFLLLICLFKAITCYEY